MNTRLFALVVGVLYLLVGLAGFIPGFVGARDHELMVNAGEGDLFGIFPVNVLHHVVHLLIGALGVLAYRTFDASRTYARGLAIVYGLLHNA